MHLSLFRALLGSLLFSYCFADQGVTVGKVPNELVGALSEYIKRSSDQPSSDLEPSYAELVQEVAHAMNIHGYKVRSHPQSVALVGPHANGNVIYFTEQWFKQWKHSSQAQKFVIGHELVHVDKAHSFLRLLCLYGLGYVSGRIFKKLSDYTTLSEKADHFFEQHFPNLPYRALLGKACLGAAGGVVGLLATTKLARAQEFEADKRALEKMGPVYGYDEVRKGAADFLKCNAGFEPRLRNIFSMHPHSGDRLRALGLKKEASTEAAALIQPLLEERVTLRIQCLLCPEDDEEQNILVTYRFTKNWQKILQAVRISSVHQDVAKHLCDQLNPVRYVELFSKKVALADNENRVSENNKHLCEAAIEGDCAHIVLCLQELA